MISSSEYEEKVAKNVKIKVAAVNVSQNFARTDFINQEIFAKSPTFWRFSSI